MRDKKAYDIEYVRNNCRRIYVLLNRNMDKDILEFLESVPNKNGFIKELIRDYIKENGSYRHIPFSPVFESANFTDTLDERDLALVKRLYESAGLNVDDIDYDYSMGRLEIVKSGDSQNAWYHFEDLNIYITGDGEIVKNN